MKSLIFLFQCDSNLKNFIKKTEKVNGSIKRAHESYKIRMHY